MKNDETISKKYFDINAYVFKKNLKAEIHNALDQILKKFNCEKLKEIIYPVIKELVINATKANIKRIFFADNGLDIDNKKDWGKGSALFKEELREKNIDKFTKKAKSLNYRVKIRYIYNKKGMRIEVVNNTPIPKIDEKRMREKLSVAMKYESLGQFYMDNVDKSEGFGMGLAMLIIMLKNEGIDPSYLRIGNNADETIARVEIPFQKDYISYRDLKYKEKLQNDKDLVKKKNN